MMAPNIGLNTGGRYNPSRIVGQLPALPTRRLGIESHGSGGRNEMIVWGGEVGSYAYSNTGGRYISEHGQLG